MLRPIPIYDRWGDSFNLSTEFVTVNQARSLAYLAWLMARTPLKISRGNLPSHNYLVCPQSVPYTR